jgi:hypothetical protein
MPSRSIAGAAVALINEVETWARGLLDQKDG